MNELAQSLLQQAADGGGFIEVNDFDPRLDDLDEAKAKGLVKTYTSTGPWGLPGTYVELTNRGRIMFGLGPAPTLWDWVRKVLKLKSGGDRSSP